MRAYLLTELSRMTRPQLLGLMATVRAEMTWLCRHSPAYRIALGNLRNIRITLARREASP